MKIHYQYIAITVFAGFSILSCSKDKVINTVPVIKIADISSTNVQEFKDSLIILLEYTDEDGDIGENDPDKNSLQIKDRRLTEADYYFVKPLAPPDSEIKITGVIRIQIKNTFLLGTGNTELTQFDIKLRDRAGNWSNTVNTPVITITK